MLLDLVIYSQKSTRKLLTVSCQHYTVIFEGKRAGARVPDGSLGGSGLDHWPVFASEISGTALTSPEVLEAKVIDHRPLFLFSFSFSSLTKSD